MPIRKSGSVMTFTTDWLPVAWITRPARPAPVTTGMPTLIPRLVP